QASLVPLQVSVVQTLPSSVHAVPLDFFASAEQLALLPGQKSSRSHSSTDARQSASEERNPSLGHVELLPLHVSATSHTPAVARQVVPALPGACWQVSLDPLHVSVVQTLPSSVHAVPLAFFASLGQLADVPVQFSARSHSPAAPRQTVVADA